MNNTKVSLAPDRSASLSGTVDVKLNGTSIWNTTKVNLMINKGKTLTINLDNQATSIIGTTNDNRYVKPV